MPKCRRKAQRKAARAEERRARNALAAQTTPEEVEQMRSRVEQQLRNHQGDSPQIVVAAQQILQTTSTKFIARNAQDKIFNRSLKLARKKVCKKGQEGQHEWIAHPTIFFATSCYHCSVKGNHPQIQDYHERLLRYLSWRRKSRYLMNLHSLSLPLDVPAYGMLYPILMQAGVRSNTATMHVTLLEGVKNPSEHFINKVWESVNTKSICTVTKIQSIPTNRSHLCLLLANVELGSFDQSLKERAPPICLPQWPLHIALGTVLVANKKYATNILQASLVGKQLGTKPEQLRWLMAHKEMNGQQGVAESAQST